MKIVLSRRYLVPYRLEIEVFGYRRPVFLLKFFLKVGFGRVMEITDPFLT
jgi:hypothetical protein